MFQLHCTSLKMSLFSFKLSLLHLILLLFAFSGKSSAQANFELNTLVIDAGHGGKDPGAVGLISYEKNIVLNIAKKLGKQIKQEFPDLNILFTREDDTFIELMERAEIANRNNADFFISIHVNASTGKSAYGTSSYVMGLKSADKNMAVAKRENSVISIETNSDKYKGFNTDTPENNIILELRQSTNIDQSITMASKVQTQFRYIKRKDLGVYQAGLIVLYNLAMPGILVEAGFISNAEEEKWLNSASGQNAVANAIFKAFKEYKIEVEAKSTGNFTLNSSKKNTQIKNTNTNKKETVSKNEAKDEKKNTVKKITQTSENYDQVIYKIQFKTSPKKMNLNSSEFIGLQKVSFYEQAGIYKYTCGEALNMQDALKILSEVKKKYKDAFIVKFKNGIRI